MLFRQLTEAIANVEKHAPATQVKVSLQPHDGGMRGVVKDDGRILAAARRI